MSAVTDTDAHDAIRRIADAELSPASRIAHGLLLAAALAMTLVIVSLGLTEPDLPLRTKAAFAVLAAIGAGWTGYAAWVLTHRRVLFARQRVIGGQLAVTFTSIFTLGGFAIGAGAGIPAGFVAGGFGLALIAVSLLLLARARRRLAALNDRLKQLEAARRAAA